VRSVSGGGNPNWGKPELGLAGDRLQAILVGVVRHNVVELAAGSIYRRSERWS
jgi:hypothetical protein